MDNNKINPKNDRVSIPVSFIPGFRTAIAVQNNVHRNLIFRTWGGIGDQICAEPTLRFALKTFQNCDISLASELPELFSHLKFKRVFNLKEETPVYDNYLCFETITPPDESNLVWQFFGHMTTNCVDFPSLCALRSQLPIQDKEVRLIGEEVLFETDLLQTERWIVVHPGKHWPSKTFPKEWWDSVLSRLKGKGVIPVLIGSDVDDNRGTVDVETDGCLDLRNKLTISECIWLLQKTKVLLTNDSSPLHMAVTGNAWIGFIATCKHPDYIMHWRKGEWGWRQKNFGLGGIWDVLDYCPNKEQTVKVDDIDPNLLASWLPDPHDFADWADQKESEANVIERRPRDEHARSI